MAKATILLVDDKANIVRLLQKILGATYATETAVDGSEAMARLADGPFDVVISDIRMPGADGFDVLKHAKERSPETEVILMTAYASIDKAVEAIKLGAYDYLPKPFDPDEVALVVARALERKVRRAEAEGSGKAPEPPAAPALEASLIQLPYRDAVELARDRVSRDYLTALLREFGGHVTRAAERAGMERESLHRLIRRYGLHPEDFRRAGDSSSLGNEPDER